MSMAEVTQLGATLQRKIQGIGVLTGGLRVKEDLDSGETGKMRSK